MINLNKNKSYYKKRAKKVRRQQENWQIQRLTLKRRNDIKNDYNKIQNKNPFRITTGKLAMWILLILCLVVIIFTGYITIKEFSLAYALGLMPDFTPLVAYWSIECFADGLLHLSLEQDFPNSIVLLESAKENTKGGITYEAAAMKNFQENLQPNGTDFFDQ